MRNSEKVIGRVGGAVEERGGDREEGSGSEEYDCLCMYMGSVLMSSIPNQCKVVLAASNDNIARIWNLSDQACKVGVAT